MWGRAIWAVGGVSAGERMPVFELLRGLAFHQVIAMVKGVEVNLDDISVGVVDPHAKNCMGLY